jgi:8-oxo-dGTP pyrophosphatase MutT (NUDIX family)
MSEAAVPEPATAVPAATVLLVRDGGDGLEVFMVKRHHDIAFAGGALVFPGGRASQDDYDAAIADIADNETGFGADTRALAVTAIREVFEEAGMLIARDGETGELVGAARLDLLQECRQQIERGEISLRALLHREGLRLACDELVRFAHWITPKSHPKRFDTHFFLARVPPGQSGRHCGREAVESVWVKPRNVVADQMQWKLMFPTKLNLMKLGRSRTVEEALAAARAAPPITVEPWIESSAEGKFIRIPDDVGYEETCVPLGDNET